LIQIKYKYSKVILAVQAFAEDPGAILMAEAADYSAPEHLRDGRAVEIRALHPDDRADMLTAIGHTGTESLRRRFFVPKKGFSERELAFFLNVDFESHIALVAQIDEDGRPAIVGGGRYVVVQPGQAEIAFMVVDAYQDQGMGTILMRHLAILARDAGLKELIAEVLPENNAMLKLFRKFGFKTASRGSPQVIHVALQLA
jgi:ribosomal protein S18 acetylase RimI-like enzyme